VLLEYNLATQAAGALLSVDTPLALRDDAVTRSSIFVPVSRQVADVQVGVRIDHPRASDLVLSLTSPQGTRVLLTENRGGTNILGYGISEALATNQVTLFTNTFEGVRATNYFAGRATQHPADVGRRDRVARQNRCRCARNLLVRGQRIHCQDQSTRRRYMESSAGQLRTHRLGRPRPRWCV